MVKGFLSEATTKLWSGVTDTLNSEQPANKLMTNVENVVESVKIENLTGKDTQKTSIHNVFVIDKNFKCVCC